MKTLKSPVIFIIYNRPDLAQRVLKAISHYQPDSLFVVADGPKNETDNDGCIQTRAIIDRVDWDCRVYKNFANSNMGCGRRVSSGLSWAFESCDQAIILEDDIVPHPSFFPFCEELLEYYKKDDRIGIISGDCRIDTKGIQESYYFSNFPHIWGWATWKRVWQNYEYEISSWPKIRQTNLILKKTGSKYFRDRYNNFLDRVHSGRLDTWDYQLALSLWMHDQVCINPVKNMIQNIGFDSRATHTKVKIGSTVSSQKNTGTTFPLIHPEEVMINQQADYRDWKRFLGKRSGIVKRMLKWIIKNKIRIHKKITRIFNIKDN